MSSVDAWESLWPVGWLQIGGCLYGGIKCSWYSRLNDDEEVLDGCQRVDGGCKLLLMVVRCVVPIDARG